MIGFYNKVFLLCDDCYFNNHIFVCELSLGMFHMRMSF
jgi:hypothetical protein